MRVIAENMIIAGLDQDYATWVEAYDKLSPHERWVLGQAIIAGQNGENEEIPVELLQQICSLAGIGFIEVGSRWAKGQEAGE